MEFRDVSMMAVMACLLAIGPTATAAEAAQCLARLSVTGTPSFAGLEARTFETDDGSSTEGGGIRVFSDSAHRPVQVLVTYYGETGKKVALYGLLPGDPQSFSARVSDYAYQRPIYTGSVEVVAVATSSFIVCGGAVVTGIGGPEIPRDVVQASRDDVARALRLASGRKPDPASSPR
jgi:hypothetical protein